MLHNCDLYPAKPLFDNIWILTFCTLMIISSGETCLHFIMSFEVCGPVDTKCLDIGISALGKQNIGHISNMGWSGSGSTSVHRKDPLYEILHSGSFYGCWHVVQS